LDAARTGRQRKFLTWTQDNLLRQIVYKGLREDKPTTEVRREMPHPKTGVGGRAATAKKPAARQH
jgi:bifunctional non-homologous end joining protein LigD